MIFQLPELHHAEPDPFPRGSRIRYKPVAPLIVIGPGGQYNQPVLVDTGADEVVFPMGVAPHLGIDVAHAPYLDAEGIGGGPARVFYAPVILALTDGLSAYRWRAVVGFSQGVSRIALLGIAGGLEFFRTTLDGARKEVELIAQPHLPATQDAVP